jgi:hypothetical protein
MATFIGTSPAWSATPRRWRAQEYELTPTFDSRKSFYGKATVRRYATGGVDSLELRSYDKLVARVHYLPDGAKDVELLPPWDTSQTTVRHVKEFLKQQGFKADTKAQMERDYL